MPTRALLQKYERRLSSLRAPIADAFAPGLEESEMEAATAALPLELSSEARLWWGWHDAIRGDADPRDGVLAPGSYMLSLEQAVAAYEDNRALAAERDDQGDPDVWWHPDWIPLLEPDSGVTIACDCSVAPGDPSPLWVVWWKLPDYDGPRRKTDSVGQMVDWWREALNAGVWSYDPENRRWQRDWEAVPADRTGLV